MNQLKNIIRNISPFNNRTEMPLMLYIVKVFILFWVVKFGAEVIGEAVVIGLHFACGKNPLQGAAVIIGGLEGWKAVITQASIIWGVALATILFIISRIIV